MQRYSNMGLRHLSVIGGMLAAKVLAAALTPRQNSNIVSVDLSVDRGVPDHYGSGILLGIPDSTWPGMNSEQIPSNFFDRISFRYGRGGGSQLPGGAWVTGLDGYYLRMNSTKSDYDKTRSFGVPYIILPHDIWGTDRATESDYWPGDGGDWAEYYRFLDQLLGDLVRLEMVEELKFDIWNEPDVPIFWKRSISQWVELYVRTHQYIRERPEFSSMEIMGPSMQEGPTEENQWWSQWLKAVSDNGIPPDQYSYHLLYGQDIDLKRFNQTFETLLATYNLPPRQLNVNEYARPEEQLPSTSAWFISRFERYDTFGLRANWLSGCQLHDFLANLLTKPSAPNSECGAGGYLPNGEWQMYAYYGTNMTGRRVTSTESMDGAADAFATVDTDRARILYGIRQQAGTWQLKIDNLTSVGLPESGTLTVQTYAFTNDGLWGYVAAPEDRGTFAHAYSGDSVSFPVYVTESDVETAFAFEFEVA